MTHKTQKAITRLFHGSIGSFFGAMILGMAAMPTNNYLFVTCCMALGMLIGFICAALYE
jgi:hypothetical protein